MGFEGRIDVRGCKEAGEWRDGEMINGGSAALI